MNACDLGFLHKARIRLLHSTYVDRPAAQCKVGFTAELHASQHLLSVVHLNPVYDEILHTMRLENDRFQRWSRFSHFLFAGAARGHLAELEGSHLRVDGPQSKSCLKCVHLHFRLEVFHFAHFKQPGRSISFFALVF